MISPSIYCIHVSFIFYNSKKSVIFDWFLNVLMNFIPFIVRWLLLSFYHAIHSVNIHFYSMLYSWVDAWICLNLQRMMSVMSQQKMLLLWLHCLKLVMRSVLASMSIKRRKSTGILAHNKNMLAHVLECITEMYICMCLYRKGHVGISEKDMQSFIKY